MYAPSSGNILPIVPGYYQVSTSLFFANNSMGTRGVQILSSNQGYFAYQYVNAVPLSSYLSVGGIARIVNATDWIYVAVYQNSTVALNVGGGGMGQGVVSIQRIA